MLVCPDTRLREVLQLSATPDRLVSSGRLNPIRIAGEVRFDSRELDALINTYQQIAKRKKSYVQ